MKENTMAIKATAKIITLFLIVPPVQQQARNRCSLPLFFCYNFLRMLINVDKNGQIF
jgi:hypothetical protein